MLTIEQFSNMHKIPVRHLKRLKSLEVLSIQFAPSKFSDAISQNLSKGNALSSLQLVRLIRDPSEFKKLSKAHQKIARAQIAMLGDVEGEALNLDDIETVITQAALGDADALQAIAQWLIGVIPEKGCDYTYIAVRALIWPLAEFLDDLPVRFSKVVQKAKRQGYLDGYFSDAERKTIFHRKKGFDL